MITMVSPRNRTNTKSTRPASAALSGQALNDSVRSILHTIDKNVRAGDLGKASEAIVKAIELAPRNMYVLAMEEHITDLLAAQATLSTASPGDPEKRPAGNTSSVVPESAIGHPARKASVAAPTKMAPKPKPESAKDLGRTGVEDLSQPSPKDVSFGQAPVIDHPDATSGPIHVSSQDAAPGRRLDHSSGSSAAAPKKPTVPLRDGNVSRPLIVIIDDEPAMLSVISSTLSDFGFLPKTFETTDEAYGWLSSHMPDAILCDVSLEASTFGGFAFFEQTQYIPHLRHVPFVFLSGLADEAISRAGKELGADDYLHKPFEAKLLVATLRGKIARYERIRHQRERDRAGE